MNSNVATVLLAGDTTIQSTTIRKWSGHAHCNWQFAGSFEEACSLMSQRDFDLVLCQYELPDRTAFPLLDWLDGSRSTLVFSARTGTRIKWLPVIEHGKRCLDRPLLQTTDLPNVLGEILDADTDSLGKTSSAEGSELVQTK